MVSTTGFWAVWAVLATVLLVGMHLQAKRRAVRLEAQWWAFLEAELRDLDAEPRTPEERLLFCTGLEARARRYFGRDFAFVRPRVRHDAARVTKWVTLKALLALALGALMAFASGCGSSLKDVEIAHAHGEGVTRLYAATEPQARDAAMSVLRDNGGVPSVTESGAIQAELPLANFRKAAIVAIWTHAEDATHTDVTVLSRGAAYGAVSPRLTTEEVHEELAKRLAPVSTTAAAR
jgi:hypothetical protein